MNGECVVGARHDAELKELQNRTFELRQVDEQQWTAINESRERYEEALRMVASRLPNWAVAAAGVGTLIIGVLGTLLAMWK